MQEQEVKQANSAVASGTKLMESSGPSLLQAFVGSQVKLNFVEKQAPYAAVKGKLLAADDSSVLLENPVEVIGQWVDMYCQAWIYKDHNRPGKRLYRMDGPSFHSLEIL